MKFKSTLAAVAVAASLAFASIASAAVTYGTMPNLYNSSGQIVNNSGGTLPSGTYYLQTGANEPVTYYGNGTYYDSAANVPGGSIYDPTGAAGSYAIPDTSVLPTYGTMPTFYNSASQVVNNTGTTVPSGTYYLQTGANQPITYFGNGVYYDPSTSSYGGSLYDPTGQLGLYGTAAPSSSGSSGSVGVPNTGAGGNAAGAWTLLAFSALAVLGGGSYLARSRYAFSSANKE